MTDHQCTAMSKQMQAFFESKVQEADQVVGFSQRASKMGAKAFVETLVLGWLDRPEGSLNDLSQYGRDLGCEVSRQAIHQRMTPRAVMLLAYLFQASLEHFTSLDQALRPVLEQFNGVYIIDSTRISLPASMWESFRGSREPYAALKAQLCVEFLSGALSALTLSDACQPDQHCRLHIDQAQAGSLVLFDLGYYSQPNLCQLDAQGSYFICRLQSQTALYDPATGQRIELGKHLDRLPFDQQEHCFELGRKSHLPVRVVARRLAPAQAAKRRRYAKQRYRRQGKACSAAYLKLLGWDLLVTNVPATILDALAVATCYRLRWQIELIFKRWKSQLKLAHITAQRPTRVLCQLYAGLIAVVLINWIERCFYQPCDTDLSLKKSFDLILRFLPRITDAISLGWLPLPLIFARLRHRFSMFAYQHRRRKSPSTFQLLSSIVP